MALIIKDIDETHVIIKDKIPKSWFYEVPLQYTTPLPPQPYNSYEFEYKFVNSNEVTNFYGPSLSTLIQEENMPTAILEKIKEVPPQEILNLMPDSIPEDWHRHRQGGWVYKDSVVSPMANVKNNAVVCGKSSVDDHSSIWTDCIVVDSHIGKHSVLNNGVFISGAEIGDHCSLQSCEVYGKINHYVVVSKGAVVEKDTIVPSHEIINPVPIELRTQKAKGIKVLNDQGFPVPKNSYYQIEKLKTEQQLKQLLNKFVRPCPVTPRHGFVDSRPIKTIEEARQIVSETKNADETAEIVAMPFINASHSGIWTEGLLSIGKGNDGATSGRDSISLCVLGIPNRQNVSDWGYLLKQAGVSDSAYLELLWTEDCEQRHLGSYDSNGKAEYANDKNYKIQYVQLRNGPKLPDSVDFIPKKTIVTSIVEAEGDLLTWEKTVKEFSDGTVVYHPGGSLASHYAVHAFLSSIPIMVSRKPEIGEILESNSDEPKPDVISMKRGFMLGCKTNITRKQTAYIMLAGCHNTTKWLGKSDLLLGLAMGCTYRLILTASLGEYRYRDQIILKKGTGKGEREFEYNKFFDKTFHRTIRKRYVEAMTSFDKEDWRYKTGSSVGGPKWFLLSRWAGLIFNSLVEDDYKSALEYMNKGVNSVHNGGWTFNKFIGAEEMSITSENPVHAVLPIAPILYDALKSGGVGLEKRFNPKRKFDIPYLDPDAYIKQRDKEAAKKKAELSGKTKSTVSKVCCTKDCCGNPDCSDCHNNKPEVVEPEIKCDCDDHCCSICWPNGCTCDCMKCHDDTKQCINCCGCGSHSCENCYPDGCNCGCVECHDNGCEYCEDKNVEGEETETYE